MPAGRRRTGCSTLPTPSSSARSTATRPNGPPASNRRNGVPSTSASDGISFQRIQERPPCIWQPAMPNRRATRLLPPGCTHRFVINRLGGFGMRGVSAWFFGSALIYGVVGLVFGLIINPIGAHNQIPAHAHLLDI